MISNRKNTDQLQLQMARNNNLKTVLFGSMHTERAIVNTLNKSPDQIQTDNIPLTLRILNE